jgi:NADH-quinone oxidoreductase subunit A
LNVFTPMSPTAIVAYLALLAARPQEASALAPTAIVAYLALFAAVGFLFVLACLLLGKLLRSRSPTPQKLEPYECGEPAVGPGSVQFDLRFYVVALVFLIFEVEVALFFPPATVFGKAVQRLEVRGQRSEVRGLSSGDSPLSPLPSLLSASSARTLALVSMLDLAVFFAVLLVGFAFVWRRGDLDWVRAIRHPATQAETAAVAARLRQGEFQP